jgi:histidinol-phosphatase
MTDMLAFAVETAVSGGKLCMPYFNSTTQVEYKSDESPITVADREVESFIRAQIAAKFPSHGIYGEEEGKAGEQSERWVIDPIDGTKSFISGVPLFGTLLSFEQDGVPQVAVCYLPAMDQVLYAERGKGAFFQGKPTRVQQEVDPAKSVLVMGSPTIFARQGRLDGVMELGQPFLAVRTWCDAFGHAMVAMGRAAAMLDPRIEPYDISAMELIISEAGGQCVNSKGERPGPDAFSFAPQLRDAILRAVG